MSRTARFLIVIILIILLLLGAFALFGFAATFEPPGFIVMRIVYGAVVLACLGAVGFLLARLS